MGRAYDDLGGVLMPTKIIREPAHIDALATILRGRKYPQTVSWSQGASRREAQNRLAQRWFTDIARQLGDTTHEDVRADCKVTFGVPIISAENDAFRQSWRETFAPLGYEAVRRAVRDLDVPVTRLMTVVQMTAFMDAMSAHWTDLGVYLTDPEAVKYESEFGPVVGAA